MTHKLERQPVVHNVSYASVEPSSLADIVKNDLAVLCAALELVHDQADLPPEMRELMKNALARTNGLADRVRKLQRMVCAAGQ